jgi:hypothetical protein
LHTNDFNNIKRTFTLLKSQISQYIEKRHTNDPKYTALEINSQNPRYTALRIVVEAHRPELLSNRTQAISKKKQTIKQSINKDPK